MKKNNYNPLIHNRQSIRLKGYDYSKAGAYFITLNTENRAPLFGEIKDGEMVMNDVGEKITEIWNIIPSKFSFVKLDEFVVMPDHFHGIIIINESLIGARLIEPRQDSEEQIGLIAPREDSEEQIGGFAGVQNPMFHENLSRIIRWFKGRSTFEIRKIEPLFQWQRNYYEHIIRNEDAFARIARYIQDNPKNWKRQFEKRPR